MISRQQRSDAFLERENLVSGPIVIQLISSIFFLTFVFINCTYEKALGEIFIAFTAFFIEPAM
jgi:hypothetical protein